MRALAFTMIVFAAACARTAPAPPGPPVRLSAGPSDTIIVNSRSPSALAVRAFDAAGRLVAAAPIRFDPNGGAAVPVSSDGIATCDVRGDHAVRATVESVTHSFVVRCRPISVLRLVGPVQFVLGDSALSQPFELPLEAFAADRRAVATIAGIVKIRDDTVAYARGTTIIPKSRGVTLLGAWAGQESAFTGVHVYQRVDPTALDTLLRIDGFQRQLAVPVQLKPGEVWQHRLPPGDWMLSTLSPSRRSPNGFRLRFANATCQDRILNEPGRFICKSASGTVVFVDRAKAGNDTATHITYLLVRTTYPPAPRTALNSR